MSAAISQRVFLLRHSSPFILPSSWRCGPQQQSRASQNPHTAGLGRPSLRSSWTEWRGPWKNIPAQRGTRALCVYIVLQQKVVRRPYRKEGGGLHLLQFIVLERKKTFTAKSLVNFLPTLPCQLDKNRSCAHLWVTAAVQLFLLLNVPFCTVTA